ncbi:MAG TPA: ABC transporter substrate-binding protein [Firmicutes bacterium]|nr:ABC transporter substrate-binding protein [Bacillota bacterium]
MFERKTWFLVGMMILLIGTSGVWGASKIELTSWDIGTNDGVIKPVYEALWAEFEKANPDIVIKHVDNPSTNYQQVFTTGMAGGSGPDITTATSYPMMPGFVKQGFCLDLTSMWRKYSDRNQFLPSSLAAGTINGKIYGVPHDMYVMGLMYNKDRFKEAGIDPVNPPKNWAEFATAAQKLTNRAKQQYGYALLGMDWGDWFFEYYVWQAGGDLTKKNADGSCTLQFTSKSTIAALQYYKDLKWKYNCVQDNVLQGFDENRTDFVQGRAAMSLAATDWFSWLVGAGIDLNKIGFTQIPAGPSGKSPSQTGGSYWIINPTISKEKQVAAFKFITFMSSKQALERVLKYQADNGIMPNLLCVRQDVDLSKYLKGVSADLVGGVQKAAEKTRLEYFLKGPLSPYVAKMMQKVLTDKNADPKAAALEAQVAAQKEVVNHYNASLKK